MAIYWQTGLLIGLRGRNFLALLLLGAGLMGVAFLTGFFSPRQPQTVALDVGFSLLRLTLVFMSLAWVQELVNKEIERKTVLLTLTYPAPRWHYLLGRYLAILSLLAVVLLPLSLMLALMAKLAGGSYQQEYAITLGAPFWLAVLGLWLDAAVVSAFGVLMASLSTTPMLPMAAGFLFAVLGRALGAVIDYIARGWDGNTAMVARFEPILAAVQWVLPDLSRLDWRAASLYKLPLVWPQLGWSVLMALAYATLCLLLASLIFSRREFS